MALLMALVLAGCGGSSEPSLASITQFQAIPDEPLPAPAATLQQSNGGSWDFQKPAAGKITLVYFGYTSCPDVCPLTMADIAGALKAVPSSVREKIAVEFVTTDPHRDTLAQLRTWLGRIDPVFVGGRAPIATVIAAARAYGISITAPTVTKKDYKVTHGAQVLVLDDKGGDVGYFRELAGLKAITRALPILVKRYA
jgi:protein SCO1/2